MHTTWILILAISLAGCSYKPVCTNEYRESLLKSRAYWEKQVSDFHGYSSGIENFNFKVKQFNYFCAGK